MKKFTQGLLVNFALIVLFVHIGDRGPHSILIFQLLSVTVAIRLLMLVSVRFFSRFPVLEYLLELGIVLAVVLSFNHLFGWYEMKKLWILIAIVVAVYAAVYAVGAGRTKRDVAFINEQIKKRKEESSNGKN